MDVAKLNGEPKRAFELFRQYLQLPKPRNLNNLATDASSLHLLEKYYKRWQWADRANEFDTKNDFEYCSSSQKIYQEKELYERIDLTLKNFAWIFADLMNRTIIQIYQNYCSKEEVDLEYFSKNISNVLKHLLDFLKIKEFLNDNSSNFLNFDELVENNPIIQKALSDIRKELIKNT